MKKVFVVFIVFFGLFTGVAIAQQGNADPVRMKERQLQLLKESDLKLTDTQADSVASINVEMSQQMRGLRDLGEDERRSKMKEMNDYRLKRWTATLQDKALAKKVAEFYEKQRAILHAA